MKWIIPVVSALCLAVDFFTKEWARDLLIPYEGSAFIPGLMRFFLTTNTGGAFSLGANNFYLMTCMATITTLGLVAWMLRRESSLVSNVERVGLGFLFGGACGNLLDRFSQGKVTDFLEFTFINFPVFNCADVFIDVGIGLILIAMLRENSARPAKEAITQEALTQETSAQHDLGG